MHRCESGVQKVVDSKRGPWILKMGGWNRSCDEYAGILDISCHHGRFDLSDSGCAVCDGEGEDYKQIHTVIFVLYSVYRAGGNDLSGSALCDKFDLVGADGLFDCGVLCVPRMQPASCGSNCLHYRVFGGIADKRYLLDKEK